MKIRWLLGIAACAVQFPALAQQAPPPADEKPVDEAVVEQHWPLFPAFYHERAEALFNDHRDKGGIPVAERVRLVADTISSLTDRQALLVYQQFTGVSPTSMLDPIVS